jgi:hypothetical protein
MTNARTLDPAAKAGRREWLGLAGAIYRASVDAPAARESLGAAINNVDPTVASPARHAFVHASSVASALGAAVAVTVAGVLVYVLTRPPSPQSVPCAA